MTAHSCTASNNPIGLEPRINQRSDQKMKQTRMLTPPPQHSPPNETKPVNLLTRPSKQHLSAITHESLNKPLTHNAKESTARQRFKSKAHHRLTHLPAKSHGNHTERLLKTEYRRPCHQNRCRACWLQAPQQPGGCCSERAPGARHPRPRCSWARPCPRVNRASASRWR